MFPLETQKSVFVLEDIFLGKIDRPLNTKLVQEPVFLGALKYIWLYPPWIPEGDHLSSKVNMYQQS